MNILDEMMKIHKQMRFYEAWDSNKKKLYDSNNF